MTLVVGASAHGSPGVTTALTVLAATWPGSVPPVIVEGDCAGGVLASRFCLAHSPGFATFASGLRYGDEMDLLDHCQALPSGVPALVGSTSASTALNQLRAAGTRLTERLSEDDNVVFLDVGSLMPWAPTAEVARAADLMLWFARPIAEELRLLYTRLGEIPSAAEAGIVLIGDAPYNAKTVHDAFDLPVFATLPYDERGARANNFGGDARFLRRSPLVRGCRTLAKSTAEMLARTRPLPLAASPEESVIINGSQALVSRP